MAYGLKCSAFSAKAMGLDCLRGAELAEICCKAMGSEMHFRLESKALGSEALAKEALARRPLVRRILARELPDQGPRRD